MSRRQTLGQLLEATQGSIKTGPFGTTLKAAEYAEDGVPLVSVGEVGDGVLSIKDSTPLISDATKARLPEYVLREGDVVFGRKGAVERSAYIRDFEDGYFLGSDGIRVRFGPQVDARFMAYQFSSDAIKDWLVAHASGTTMPSMNQKILSNLSVSVPELIEQKAIAKVLGAIDDKIAANENKGDVALNLARLAYEQGVAGTQLTPMLEVLNPLLGGTPKRSDESLWDGTVPWTSAKDITAAPSSFVVATEEGISEEAAAPRRLSPLPRGSVVLTARGTVGKVARLSIEAAINQSCYGFVPDTIPAGCLGFVIEDVAARVKSMAHGSVFDTITNKTFSEVTIPALSREQWGHLEARVEPLVHVAEQAVIESLALARTRDELLPLLMSGKITVRDAEMAVSNAV